MTTESSETVNRPQAVGRAANGSMWSRHKTLVNFSLDAVLLVVFLVMAWLMAVLVLVFPRGSVRDTIWGATASEWQDALFAVFCVFGVGVVVHVMLHWGWICGTVSTKLLGRKASKDDGSQTLIGVGFLMFLLHILGAAVLAARISMVSPG